MEYDKTYKLGNTIVHVVSPETTLGRRMTKDEIDAILQDCAKVNLEIFNSRHIEEVI